MRDFKVGDRLRLKEDYMTYPAGHVLEVVKYDRVGDPVTLCPNGMDDPWYQKDLHDIAELITDEPDTINHPDHYQSESGIECIDAIRAALTPEEFRGYCKGAALKYIWRERKKGGNESLGKGVWYLNEAQK